MPRAKLNTHEPYFDELSQIAILKRPFIDLIYDFKIIYPLQMKFFSDYLMDYDIEKNIIQ